MFLWRFPRGLSLVVKRTLALSACPRRPTGLQPARRVLYTPWPTRAHGEIVQSLRGGATSASTMSSSLSGDAVAFCGPPSGPESGLPSRFGAWPCVRVGGVRALGQGVGVQYLRVQGQALFLVLRQGHAAFVHQHNARAFQHLAAVGVFFLHLMVPVDKPAVHQVTDGQQGRGAASYPGDIRRQRAAHAAPKP